jgi:hypothetical protein
MLPRLEAMGSMPTVALISASVVVSAMASITGAQSVHFDIRSDFGAESAWTQEYLEKAYGQLVKLMDNSGVKPPAAIHVELKRDPAVRGVGGAATENSLTFTTDQWPRDRWRLWILAHELTNLFAHHYGGAGGYPADWWADGRSPFPVYVAALVTEQLGEKEAAQWLKTVDRDKSDQKLFWTLHERFGFRMFARFFKLLREDGIDLGRIGAKWPAPDERRSAWAIAYLSIAAGVNLAPAFREAGIGTEPPDWRQRHPDVPFRAYSIPDRAVADLMDLRAHLFGSKAQGRAIEILRDLFRHGDTWPAQTARSDDAGASGPIAFAVESDFGAESEWTAAYVSKAAAALFALFDDAGLRLPARVTVRLHKNPAVKGIGGGAQADSIEFTSDQWPQEQFRLWILASELVVLFGHHAGGKVPADWLGNGSKPFATYASELVLRKVGQANVADWVRGMNRKPEDELFRALHDAYGFAVFARAFALMRKDGVDFSKLGAADANPQRIRTHQLIAYLSAAAGKNLATVFREHRIGSAPEGAPKDFKPYAIDDAEVERLIRARAK